MASSPKAGDSLTVATIKVVHPHYTDAQAEAHLAAHTAAAGLRALVPDGPQAARVNASISQIVSIIAQATR